MFGTPTSAKLTTLTSANNIDALLSGLQWSSNTVTFSFTDSTSDYESNYGAALGNADVPTVLTGFQSFTSLQKAATKDWISQYVNVSNLNLVELTGTQDRDATIRMAGYTFPAESTAAGYAGLPGGIVESGDIFLTTGDFLANSKIGNFAYHAIGHELGHALGLKHGQEASPYFGLNDTLRTRDRDSMEFSILTYRSYIDAPLLGYFTNEMGGYAQSLMMDDIRATQQMYGANFNSNSSNTVYRFSTTTGEMFVNGVGQGTPTDNRIFRTIWDGNGNDTYDFSNYTTNLAIDLTPGGWSDLNVGGNFQRAQLGSSNYARAHVFNALQYNGDVRSLIENANGGSGNDRLIGNSADNILDGGIGADTIIGGSGNDTYIVDNAGDIVTETSTIATEIDTVRSAINYTLGENIEWLILTATAVNGTGNELANILTGNSANNILNGGIGADTILGGAGNDLLDGGADNDTLDGGAGNDNLIGGAGIDTAIYSGRVADYGITPYSIVDNRLNSPDGTDSIGSTIEFFKFADATVINRNAIGIINRSEVFGKIELALVNGKYAAIDLSNNIYTPLLYDGNTIGSTSFAGWSVVGTERIGDVPTGEIEYMWKSSAGEFWYSTNSKQGGFVAKIDLILKEADFQQDFNNDGTIGLVESFGTSTLKINSSGQYVASIGGANINLKYAGQNFGPNSFNGWSVIGAEIDGANVKQMWQSTTGQYWYSTNTDNGGFVASNNLFLKEAEFQQDFDNDGTIGLVESFGTSTLKINSTGQYVASIGGANINLKYAGQNFGPNSFSGWSVIGAEIDGTNVKQMWQSTTGQYWYSTNTDNGGIVNATAFESTFQQDFDGDSFITTQGTSGNNTFIGTSNSDRFVGLAGDDIYTFSTTTDRGTDTIVEAAGEGTDTIIFTGNGAVKIDLSQTTSQTINTNLVLTVANLENVIGGGGNDTIKGNSSNNILTGGAGADAFVFGGTNATSLVAIGTDTITDFTVNLDKILLNKSTFKLAATSGNPLQAGDFSVVTSDLDAGNSTAGIVYNSINGKLFYNEDGNAGGLGTNGGQFAQLATGLNLTANDFNAIV